MRHLIIIVALSLSPTAAVAGEPASSSAKHLHHDGAAHGSSGTGMSSGKVSYSDLSFTSKSAAAAKCPGGATLDRPDGSFACDVSSSSMAINEKGTAGTKGTPKKDQK